ELLARLLRGSAPRLHRAMHLFFLDFDGLTSGVDALLDLSPSIMELIDDRIGDVVRHLARCALRSPGAPLEIASRARAGVRRDARLSRRTSSTDTPASFPVRTMSPSAEANVLSMSCRRAWATVVCPTGIVSAVDSGAWRRCRCTMSLSPIFSPRDMMTPRCNA